MYVYIHTRLYVCVHVHLRMYANEMNSRSAAEEFCKTVLVELRHVSGLNCAYVCGFVGLSFRVHGRATATALGFESEMTDHTDLIARPDACVRLSDVYVSLIESPVYLARMIMSSRRQDAAVIKFCVVGMMIIM
jgi:hypothetical protein